jgi:hypothetical protein
MGMASITKEDLDNVIRYDPETGMFTWLVYRQSYGGGIYPGKIAGTMKDGYVKIILDQKQYRAHRLAWFIMTGTWPIHGTEIDHANGNRADNRWANLRAVTRTQNNMNLPPRTDNKSGHRGVSWRKDTQQWHARIGKHGKTILLGNFDSLEDAVAARVAAESEHFGDHSYLRRA